MYNIVYRNQDSTELEAQIDQMVYELYGLSEDEVAVVEGGEPLANESQIEYNDSMENEA